MAQKKWFYADKKLIDEYWLGWLEDGDPKKWDALLKEIYKVCQGASTNFHPKNEDEHQELIHTAFAITIDKIKRGKLKTDPSRGSVFNLLTTAIMRTLYSLMNRNKKDKRIHDKYVRKLSENDKLSGIEFSPY